MSKRSTDKQRSQWEVDIFLATESIAAAVEQWLKEFQQGVETGDIQRIQKDIQKVVAAVKDASDQWSEVFKQRHELVKVVTEKSQPDKQIRDELNDRVGKIWEKQEYQLDNLSRITMEVRKASYQLQMALQHIAAVVTEAHQDCQNELQLLLSEFGSKTDGEEDGL